MSQKTPSRPDSRDSSLSFIARSTNPVTSIPKTDALFGLLIREINQKFGSGVAFEQILDFTFDALNLLIPFDRIGIALVEENREQIRLLWVKSKLPVESLTVNYAAPLRGSSLEKIIEGGEIRIINDLTEYLRAHPDSQSTRLVLKDGIRSSLTCPLRLKNVPVGAVFFSSREPNTYKREHVETFTAIADELSLIVEQAKLQRYFDRRESDERSWGQILHDLRSPIGIIQGYLDLARQEEWFERLPENAKNVFSVLNRNANNMLTLLEELSQLKEIKASTNTLEKQMVKLSDFTSEVVQAGIGLAQRKEIVFDSSIKQLPKEAQFDSLKIRRVLDNLMTNAVKFSKRGTRIVFTVEATQDRLVFSVSDTGLGIREDEIPKLFSEFGKTSTRPTERETSTGLGLAISKDIVERHGGKISVTSRLGVGSTFTFWIPMQTGTG